MQQQYAGRKIDVIVPCFDSAIRFVLKERAVLIPGVPVVFCAAEQSEVVRHLRALFKKEHADRQPLNINDVIREITRLLGKDLERKRVSLRLRLGMDLSISRSIVQAHGGRIWATRNKDRGLTIHIELPCPGT